MPNEWNFRERDWRLPRIEGNISFVPQEQQSAEDYDGDGDDALLERHDCVGDLVVETPSEARESERILQELKIRNRICKTRR